ncbi:hypothetical protein YQE_10151, partial [Dendroctonus ponderosae]
MYGRYSRQLGEFAKLEGLKAQEKRRLKEEKARKKELRGYQATGVVYDSLQLRDYVVLNAKNLSNKINLFN